jgi:hypothetical protein
MRLQLPQNGWVTGAITPISPAPWPSDQRVDVSEGLPAGRRVRGSEGEFCGDSLNDFSPGDDVLPMPSLPCAQRHELDEPHDDILLVGKIGQAHDIVIIQPANDHRVELDRGESHRLGYADRLEHLRQPVTPCDFF